MRRRSIGRDGHSDGVCVGARIDGRLVTIVDAGDRGAAHTVDHELEVTVLAEEQGVVGDEGVDLVAGQNSPLAIFESFVA